MSGFNINKIERDKKLSTEGVWVDAGDGLEVKVVCMLDSVKYKEHMLQKGKLLRRGVGRSQNNISVSTLQKVQAEGVAKYILKGWNLTEIVDGEEQPIDFSVEKAIEIFDRAPDFLDIIAEVASDTANFQMLDHESLEEDAKN